MAILNNDTAITTFEIVNKSESINNSCFNCTPVTPSDSRAQLYTTILVSIIAIILNLMICYAIRKEKLLKSSIYIFIFNICISDLITPLGAIVNSIAAFLKNNSSTNMIKEWTCKISFFTTSMSFSVSTLSLMVLAIDRYYTLLDNQGYQSPLSGRHRIKAVIVFIWIYAIAMNSPQLHLLHITQDGSSTCDVFYYSDNYNIPYYIIVFVFSYCIPLLVMIIMYARIIIHLKVAVVDRNPDSSNISDFQISRKRSISIMKMIVIATVIYMITSFPIPVIMVATSLRRMTVTELRQSIHPILSSLITVGLAISILCCIQNPIIYLILNSTLRDTLTKNFSCCHRKNKCDSDANKQLIRVSTQQPNLKSISTT